MPGATTGATALGLLVIEIPRDAALAFQEGLEEDFAAKGLRWQDDPTRVEEEAGERLAATFPADVVSLLRRFKHDKDAPSAVLLKGLPEEEDLPQTVGEPPISRKGQLVEALMLGVAATTGLHVFCYEMQSKSYGGPTSYIHDVYPKEKFKDEMGVFGTVTALPLHREFPFVEESKLLDCLMLGGVRADRNKEAKTTVVDYRHLVSQMDPRDVELLRTNEVQWEFLNAAGEVTGRQKPKLGITGPDDDPICNITFCDTKGTLKSRMVAENPEALEAYNRMLQKAEELSEGVLLGGGDLLLINNMRAAHGRTAYTGETFDGYGRWFKRTYLKDFDVKEFPTRMLPTPF